ncbi:RsfA family transcriptional regulator [Bacillus shivajii]|uniref:RsfA family transcriptional regulator n=1 Tax=Bacillus shivajii TaxID=1983719 RepID=UPI00299F1A2C|nr:RsfA family transcriptional regulator [Bacillus shivajii]
MISLVRQDAWNHDEDLLLAEVVLRHIREGSTQLAAFEEVGEKLSRTPAACGFRWNSAIRKKYDSAIQLAKKQRRELKGKSLNGQAEYQAEETKSSNEPTKEQQQELVQSIDQVVAFLLERKDELLHKGNDERNIKLLEEKNESLQLELERLKEEYEFIKSDYQLMINVVERATKRKDDESYTK